MTEASDRAALSAAYAQAISAAGNSDPNPSVGAVIVDTHGKTRARFLLSKVLEHARGSGVSFPATVSTPYPQPRSRIRRAP